MKPCIICRHPGGRIIPRIPLYGALLLFPLAVLLACNSSPKMGEDGVANMDPVPAGSLEAEFPRLLSSALEKRKIDVVFRPRDNLVYLEFKHQTVTYRQYWDRANRARFREALEKYKGDYEARTLVDRPYRTRRLYGVVKGSIQWGYPLNISILVLNLNSLGYPSYEMGYVFKEDSSRRASPYFTVFQRETKNVLQASDKVEGKSLNIFIHFTRAQAEELAGFFDQDYLLSLIQAGRALQGDVLPEADSY